MQSDPSNRRREIKSRTHFLKENDVYENLEVNTWMLEGVKNAMDDYAEQFKSLPPSGEEETAVGFAEWTHGCEWHYCGWGQWEKMEGGKMVRITTAELYTFYLESKTQGK